jgi:hypothetical protein
MSCLDTYRIRGGARQRLGRFDRGSRALGEALEHQDDDCRVEVEGPGGRFYSDDDIRRWGSRFENGEDDDDDECVMQRWRR